MVLAVPLSAISPLETVDGLCLTPTTVLDASPSELYKLLHISVSCRRLVLLFGHEKRSFDCRWSSWNDRKSYMSPTWVPPAPA